MFLLRITNEGLSKKLVSACNIVVCKLEYDKSCDCSDNIPFTVSASCGPYTFNCKEEPPS